MASPQTNQSTTTASGLQALRDGNRQLAREMLSRAVRENPTDDDAWLGLAEAFTEPDRQRYCIERVLAANPNSAAAQQAFAELAKQPAEPPPVEPVASPAPSARTVPRPAGETPLAARLAAAQARRNEQHEPAVQPVNQAAPQRLEPPAHNESQSAVAKRERVSRARRSSELPLQLRPVTFSEMSLPALERPSEQKVAEAALERLLHHERVSELRQNHATPARTIADRYFGTPHPAGETIADQALHALQESRPRWRVHRVVGAVAVLGVVVVLLVAAVLVLGALMA
jgi:hypothetical protein